MPHKYTKQFQTRSSAINLGSTETLLWIEAISALVKIGFFNNHLVQLTQFQL